jgi:hypothetical protein
MRDRIACCFFGASFFCTAKSLERSAGLSASAPWFACPAFRFRIVQNHEESFKIVKKRSISPTRPCGLKCPTRPCVSNKALCFQQGPVFPTRPCVSNKVLGQRGGAHPILRGAGQISDGHLIETAKLVYIFTLSSLCHHSVITLSSLCLIETATSSS